MSECWLKENPCITILHGSGARFSCPLCLPRVHTQEMLNLLQTMKAESGGGSDRRGEGLKERRFRELGNFSGSKEEWNGLKFCAVVKETEPELFKAMLGGGRGE